MPDSKIMGKLDALLRLYYNEASTVGEKDNALSLFEKKCKKEGINPEEYKKKFEKSESKSSSSRSGPSSNSYDVWSDGDLNDIFEAIFGRGRRGRHNYGRYSPPNKHDDKTDAHRYEEAQQNIDYEAHSKYVKKEHSWFKIKDLIVDTTKDVNNRDVIFISCLAQTERQKKWALTNFVIFPNAPAYLLMDRYFKTKGDSKLVDSEFIVHTDKRKYYRDHYNVVKIWKLNDDGKETKILF
jgi:hypothetical protein